MPADHREALGRMQSDADMASEAAGLDAAMRRLAVGAEPRSGGDAATAGDDSAVRTPAGPPPLRHVRLNWRPGGGGHQPSPETVSLLREVGGRPGVARFTDAFYALAFRDPHLDRFIRDRSDPHGDRFADWVTEKLGDGTPWSSERAGDPACVCVCARTHTCETSAHVAPAQCMWSTCAVAHACLYNTPAQSMREYRPRRPTTVPPRLCLHVRTGEGTCSHTFEQCWAGRKTCPFQSHGHTLQTPHDR